MEIFEALKHRDSEVRMGLNDVLTFGLLLAAAVMLQACGGIDRRDSAMGETPEELQKPVVVVPADQQPLDNKVPKTGDQPSTVNPLDDEGEQPVDAPKSTTVDRIQLIDDLNQMASTIRVADDNSDNSETDAADLTQAERVRLQLKSDKEMRKLACVNLARRVTECVEGTTFDLAVLLDMTEFYAGSETGDENISWFCDDFANEDLTAADMEDMQISNIEDMIDELDAGPDEDLSDLMNRVPCSMVHEATGEAAFILSDIPERLTFYFAGFASRFQNATSSVFGVFGRVHVLLRSKIRITGGEFDRDTRKIVVVWTKNENDGGSVQYTKWGDIALDDSDTEFTRFTLLSNAEGQFRLTGKAPPSRALNRKFGRETLGVGHLVVVDKSLNIPDGTVLYSNDRANDGKALIDKLKLNGEFIGKAISQTHAFIYRGNSVLNGKSARAWQGHFTRGLISCVKPLDVNSDQIDYLYLQPAIANYSEVEIEDYIFPPDKDFQSGENGCFDPASNRYAPFELDLSNRSEIGWLGETPLGEFEHDGLYE